MKVADYEILDKDIAKFEKLVKDLDRLVEQIRKYEPSAHLYITPAQVNLMTGYGSCVGQGKLEKDGDEYIMAEAGLFHMDVGDW